MATYPDTGSFRTEQSAQQSEQILRELLISLEGHARGMWRYRWQAVGVIWIASIIGWFTVYTMPPTYEANARIYVDTENALRPLLRGIAIQSNVINEVLVVTREMLSRPNLAEVARATDLDLRVNSEEAFDSLLTSLRRRIQISSTKDNIFSISYHDTDRARAVAVVTALVNTFVEKSLGADREESRQARLFLQQQIDDYESRLTVAEDRLANFKRDNGALMPGQGGGYFARLQAAEESLGSTKARLRLARERRAELLRQLEGEEPVFGIMSAEPIASSGSAFAAGKIRDLEAQLEELRLRYTDKHPRIGQILDTIELLRTQQEQESSAARIDGNLPSSANPLDLNPVYQNMRIQLTNTEVEIASMRAEVDQQQRQVRELKLLIDTVPQVEAELGRLNRDYGVVKSKHGQLLAKLETAIIGEDAERSIDDVQFRIIDPPFSSLKPAGPQRQLLLSVTLVVALGLGGALIFLLNQLNPVFFSSRAVSTVTGIPVLGSVGLLISPEELRKKKKDRFSFAVAIGLLLVAFTLLSIFADQLSPALRNSAGLS